MPQLIKGKQIAVGTLADGTFIEENAGKLRIKDQAITNAKINNGAAIADSKLAQITTGNKVASSAIVLDGSGGLASTNAGLKIDASGVTNAMLAGSIENGKLQNSSMTIAGSSVALGGTLAASAIASAVDGEAMALTAVTDLDAANAGSLTIFDGLLAGAGNILTIGGDAASVVKIAGNLQVTGSVDTVSTTELQVDDLTILCAKGANNAASANGAGLKIDLSGGNFAQILYANASDRLVANKVFQANSFLGDLAGNADSADQWSTARTVTFANGDVTGSFQIQGHADVSNVQLTISGSSVEGGMLNANVVDNASLVLNNSGGSTRLQIKDAGVKAVHLDIKKASFMLDNSEPDVTVHAESGETRPITLNEVGSTGTTAKFNTANADSRQKILVFINGVAIPLASSAATVGSGAGKDGDYFIADESSDNSHLRLTLNKDIYDGESDILTIYGPASA